MIINYDLTYEEYLNAGYAMVAGTRRRWETPQVAAYAVGGVGVVLLFQEVPARAVIAAELLIAYALFTPIYPYWTS